MSETKNFPCNGNAVAAILAAIHSRCEIPELCGESIVDSEKWGDRYSAVSLSLLGVTAVTVPNLIGCTPRKACEAKGMHVLGVATVDDVGESIVLVRGCGNTNRPAIEAMWRAFDADVANAPAAAAALAERPCCDGMHQHAALRDYWSMLARFFARVSLDHGLGICSDLLVADESDDLVSVADGTTIEDASEDSEGVFVQIGSGPSLHVLADPQSPPSAGDAESDADRVFASIESLGCTVFLFSADADALEDFEASAKRTCDRFGLHLLGVCFIDDTLECLVIVSGTRQETERKVGCLWEATEGDPGRLRESVALK